jgi:hypothetical protein
MEQIAIGKSKLMTSRIGLGTWAMGGWMWGGTDEAQSIETIRSAIDHGVTLIDTAPVYGFGRSEEIVGKALEGSLRHKVTIATKLGLAWKDGVVYRDSRPAASDRRSRIRCDGCALMSSISIRCIGRTSRRQLQRPRARWKTSAARVRFGPSASVIFRQPRCVCSALTPNSTPCNRHTTFLSVQSRRMCCHTRSALDWQSRVTERSVVVS